MKTSILFAAVVATFPASLVWAQNMPVGGKSMTDKPATTMDMDKGAQKPAAAASSGMNTDADNKANPMQANMDKMQRQMSKITTTTDPKMRQTLMQEHMQTMQENMKAMRGMTGSNTNGEGQMNDQKASMPTSDMQKRQDMTDMRMNMMQDMMEQMMERDKASKPMGHM